MIRYWTWGLAALFLAAAPVVHAQVAALYDLKTQTLQGQPADLAAYRGKVTLVVNVASECGYTPQYEGLEALHREVSGKGFAVLGFPSNDFGGQEPGTAQQIVEFCRKNYGVTFPMFAKLSTVPGRTSRRSTGSSARRAICPPGTSASTSSAKTARSSRSFQARSRRKRPSSARPSRRLSPHTQSRHHAPDCDSDVVRHVCGGRPGAGGLRDAARPVAVERQARADRAARGRRHGPAAPRRRPRQDEPALEPGPARARGRPERAGEFLPRPLRVRRWIRTLLCRRARCRVAHARRSPHAAVGS